MIIGINGFGRIGRCIARLAISNNNIQKIHINDLADQSNLMHLLKYDSIHGSLQFAFEYKNNDVVFENGTVLSFSKQSKPKDIPWKQSGAEIILECTGRFLSEQTAKDHFIGGARKIILSAPAKDKSITSIVLGVNNEKITADKTIFSNASCTTNCAAPLISVSNKLSTINACNISTIHSFTSVQNIHDAPHKDLRRARAASLSIIPTTTGAVKAIELIFPHLKNKVSGGCLRVPVPNGSITEIILSTEKRLSIEEINNAMKNAADNELKGILGYTEEPIVSTDIIGSKYSSIFDAKLTTSTNSFIKISGWYDNEMGYSNRMLDLAFIVNKK